MSKAIEFLDELPAPTPKGPNGPTRRLARFADKLRENKGSWALHPTQSKQGTTNNLRAWHINSGRSSALPGEEFEACVRQGKMYVRALPRKRKVG